MFDPTVEIVPPFHRSPLGAANEGLKILDLEATAQRLAVDVEGLAGRSYTLEVIQADRIRAVSGATREGSRLQITMPDGVPDAFVRHRVVMETR